MPPSSAPSTGRANPRGPAPTPPLCCARAWLGRNALRIYGVLAFAYLFAPIAYITVFSFNDGGKSNLVWRGFTLKNWANPCGAPGRLPGRRQQPEDRPHRPRSSRRSSARWWRSPWPGTGSAAGPPTNLLIFLPMATPEVVLAASLLTLFLQTGADRHHARHDDDHHRARHVLHQLRRGHGQGPDRRASTRGWSRRRRTCTRTSRRRSAGSRCRSSRRASPAARCWRSACPSTTSSSPTSTPAT